MITQALESEKTRREGLKNGERCDREKVNRTPTPGRSQPVIAGSGFEGGEGEPPAKERRQPLEAENTAGGPTASTRGPQPPDS